MSSAVLVVEDDRELRDVVRRYLERAGHAVHTTGSGAEALSVLVAGGVDLVVLDLGLPDVDGLEVLAAARNGGGVPVVVLTARSQLEDRIDGLRRGVDASVVFCCSLSVPCRIGARKPRRPRGSGLVPARPADGTTRARDGGNPLRLHRWRAT